MEFFHKKTNFQFMATRKVWYSLSAVLMVGSFVSFFMLGLNFAIDFTGGINVEVAFPQDAEHRKDPHRGRGGRVPRTAGADLRFHARRDDPPQDHR